MTTGAGRRYYHERYNEVDAIGEARGRALGRAEALLLLLETRRITVPDRVREQILACPDIDRHDLWLRRAATAGAIDDVTGPDG
jgi:hypothetical protein